MDGNHNPISYDVDHWGRITGIGFADGVKEGYEYTPASQVCRTTDGNGNSVQYRYNSFGKVSERIDQLGYAETFRYDEEGNLSLHIDRDGRSLQRDCNVFGNRIRYTGQQYDEFTDQYYLRARYYNPVLGRFMQEDVYQGDGLNLYAYCKNNPILYYDSSGYAKKKPCVGDQIQEGDDTSEKNSYMSNQEANKIKNEILGGNDYEFRTQAEALEFIERKFPNFAQETAGHRSAEGWHFDSHQFEFNGDPISHINIYSKDFGFRVHITWRDH